MGIDDLPVAHPALGRDRRRVAQRAEESELGGGVHVDLAAAFQPPGQFLPGLFILRARALRIHAAEARRERVGEIGRLLRGEAARISVRRQPLAVVHGGGRDLPQAGLDAVGEGPRDGREGENACQQKNGACHAAADPTLPASRGGGIAIAEKVGHSRGWVRTHTTALSVPIVPACGYLKGPFRVSPLQPHTLNHNPAYSRHGLKPHGSSNVAVLCRYLFGRTKSRMACDKLSDG